MIPELLVRAKGPLTTNSFFVFVSLWICCGLIPTHLRQLSTNICTSALVAVIIYVNQHHQNLILTVTVDR